MHMYHRLPVRHCNTKEFLCVGMPILFGTYVVVYLGTMQAVHDMHVHYVVIQCTNSCDAQPS